MGHEGHDHFHGHLEPERALEVVQEHASPAAQVTTFIVSCFEGAASELDETGALLKDALQSAGHSVSRHEVIRKNKEAIRAVLEEAVEAGARAIFLNGGTGLGRKDETLEVLSGLFEKKLPGFDELLRMLCYKQFGSAAFRVRASAGTYRGALVFALPNSLVVARLALESLILPELGQTVRELTGM